jgi:hypothetical protein
MHRDRAERRHDARGQDRDTRQARGDHGRRPQGQPASAGHRPPGQRPGTARAGHGGGRRG